MKPNLYDQSWLSDVESKLSRNSWAYHVIKDVNESGQEYLSILREWHLSFPLPSRGKKKHMKNALESLNNYDHLGAVNELCWYRFMCDLAVSTQALQEGNGKTPDFKCTSPSGIEFYCEVTTLNVSSKETEFNACGIGTPLNQDAEISRIIRKATLEKAEQLKFGEKEQKPMVFVVFDYSTFSGFGTERPLALADALLKTSKGLEAMQPYLSAIIYVERYVRRGRCRIRASQSAVCHNPLAHRPLPLDIFGCFRQYALDSYSSVEPKTIDIVIS